MAKAEYRSSLRSKRLIYEALADLLQEKPLENITVTELVRRADINRGTFYAHFVDIPDVADHILDQYFEKISSAFQQEDLTLDQWPGVLARQMQRIFEEDAELTMKLASSPASTYIERKLTKLMIEHLMLFEERFPQISHEDFIVRLRFCARGMAGMYHDWLTGIIFMPLPELTKKAETLLSGIINNL